jgi:hypothetical protein
MAKSTADWKHFAMAFAIALVGYVVVYNWIEHRRVVRGPWEVTFQNDAGQLNLVLNQPHLGIKGVHLRFPEVTSTTNFTETIQFTGRRPVPFPIPFGRCVFQDPLYLPGTVVLEIAAHRIQLLPRALTIDGVEHDWTTTNEWHVHSPVPSAVAAP